MKERPILFSGPMVSAILEGRKTQTRRVIKHRFDDKKQCEHTSNQFFDPAAVARHCEHGSEWTNCPYGTVGDRLWVREAFQFDDSDPSFVYYRESEKECSVWKPSIHMPRWASRINLEITGVRVERLQDISEEDAFAEGVESNPYVFPDGTVDDMMGISAVSNFECLWNSINEKRGFGWEVNPWVWVLEFKVVK